MIKILLHIFLILYVLNAHALTAQQNVFKRLYAQALKGDEQAVIAGKKQLPDYVLTHYLDFALITAQMAQLPRDAIASFQKDHPESPLSSRLDEMLTYELGKQQLWEDYLKRYKNNRKSQTMHCWYLQARIATKQFKGLAAMIGDFWMNGLSLPNACNPVFSWWESQGHLTEALIAQRIKLAFSVNNAATAGYLAAKMQSKPQWVDYALLLMRTPLVGLKQALNWQDTVDNRELVYHKALATAQKNPNDMYTLWPLLQKNFAFNASQITNVERTIALFAATDYLPFTITAMDGLPATAQDGQIYAWKTRYYLYHQDWQNVLKTIQSMPAFQRNKDNWQYWLARASAKTGDKDKAKAVFSQLALKSNYYGFLAADHLQLAYEICSQDMPATEIVTLPKNLEIAFELFALDMISEARAEWIIGYQQLNQGQRRALADIAYAKGWYNKVSAITAALGLWNNYALRYPLAYQQEITELATQHNLLPQWIMSIITQESAWQTDAISRADARGLMQIIDATAKRISQKLGLSYWGKAQLHEAYFNMRLGIYYQRLLFDQFNNHPILALASYNAGESKAKDWLNGFPQSPDIWAETIPFLETRDYITKILTNITIYDWLINQTPRRISYWMPTFPVDGQSMQSWPNAVIAAQTTSVRCSQ